MSRICTTGILRAETCHPSSFVTNLRLSCLHWPLLQARREPDCRDSGSRFAPPLPASRPSRDFDPSHIRRLMSHRRLEPIDPGASRSKVTSEKMRRCKAWQRHAVDPLPSSPSRRRSLSNNAMFNAVFDHCNVSHGVSGSCDMAVKQSDSRLFHATLPDLLSCTLPWAACIRRGSRRRRETQRPGIGVDRSRPPMPHTPATCRADG